MERLKRHGYVPDVILDVGANQGDWTRMCLALFPHAKYYLFEPTPYVRLLELSEKNNVRVFNCVLSDRSEDVNWYSIRGTGDSMFKENTHHYTDCAPVKVRAKTLNDIFYSTSLSNAFIKIDCQGAEIPILKGASNLLASFDFVLLELPFFGKYNSGVPSFFEHITFMYTWGYDVFDICELHNVADFLVQVDVMFIKRGHPLQSKVQSDISSR